MRHSDIQDKLLLLIRNSDHDALRDLMLEIDDHFMSRHEVTQEVFSAILYIIGRIEFHEMQGSFMLLELFLPALGNIEYMTDSQKFELLNSMEKNYSLFKDSTTCFTIVEVIAALFPDERSLDVLLRLKNTSEVMPRCLVPHGLEYFIRNWSNSEFAEQALKELMGMLEDPEFEVRDEAETSLRILRKEGLSR